MIQLFEQTRDDQSAQVSMYDIGGRLGLERDAASKVAQELIGLQLVEIRTLAGGIGISAAGSEMVQALIGPLAADPGDSTKLGSEPLLDSAGRHTLEKITAEIKDQAGTLGLDFDTLAELMADLKSIDAQLESSRPKTAIIRECLHSLSGVLKGKPNSPLNASVNGFLGNT
jgi:hypothetical protein